MNSCKASLLNHYKQEAKDEHVLRAYWFWLLLVSGAAAIYNMSYWLAFVSLMALVAHIRAAFRFHRLEKKIDDMVTLDEDT